MMPKPLVSPEPAETQGRPFPWFCPRCRRKEVRRVTIPYQCQRRSRGQPVTVLLSRLDVPQCQNCGELVFDYVAEEQINRAFEAQTSGSSSGATDSTAAEVLERARQLPAQVRVRVVRELAAQLSPDEQAELGKHLLAQLPLAPRPGVNEDAAL
jgi:hypothetical protein